MRKCFAAIGFIFLAIVLVGAGNEEINTIPAANSNFLTDLQNFLDAEDAARYAEMFSPIVVSGGLHGTAGGMTSAAFATVAYSNLGKRINQPAAAIDYSLVALGCGTDDVAWVIASALTASTSGNFDRVAGTDYFVDCQSATQPALPSDSVWLMVVTLTSGAIADVRVAEPRQRILGLRLVCTPESFGAVGDGTTDDFQAFQDMIDSCNRYDIPERTYRIGTGLIFDKQDFVFQGRGFASIIKPDADIDLFLIGDVAVSSPSGFKFADFKIDCQNDGIQAFVLPNHPREVILDNIWYEFCGDGDAAGDDKAVVEYRQTSGNALFSRQRITCMDDGAIGFVFDTQQNGLVFSQGAISQCATGNSAQDTGTGIIIRSTSKGNVIIGSDFEQLRSPIVMSTTFGSVSIIGNSFESNSDDSRATSAEIFVAGGAYIVGNGMHGSSDADANYGIEVGNSADFVVIEGNSSRDHNDGFIYLGNSVTNVRVGINESSDATYLAAGSPIPDKTIVYDPSATTPTMTYTGVDLVLNKGLTGGGDLRANSAFVTNRFGFVIDDSLDGNPGTGTLDPEHSYYEITCDDGDGCELTISDTGFMVDGQYLMIGVLTSAVVPTTILRIDGQVETKNDANCVLEEDEIWLGVSRGDRWLEVICNNTP